MTPILGLGGETGYVSYYGTVTAWKSGASSHLGPADNLPERPLSLCKSSSMEHACAGGFGNDALVSSLDCTLLAVASNHESCRILEADLGIQVAVVFKQGRFLQWAPDGCSLLRSAHRRCTTTAQPDHEEEDGFVSWQMEEPAVIMVLKAVLLQQSSSLCEGAAVKTSGLTSRRGSRLSAAPVVMRRHTCAGAGSGWVTGTGSGGYVNVTSPHVNTIHTVDDPALDLVATD